MKAFLKGKGQTQRPVLSVPVCIRYAEWANPQREKADSGLQGWGEQPQGVSFPSGAGFRWRLHHFRDSESN